MNVRFPSDFEELDQVEEEFLYYGLPVPDRCLLGREVCFYLS
jgi:hypothetical protein